MKYWGFTESLREMFPNAVRDCSHRKILITDVLLEKLKEMGKSIQKFFAFVAYEKLRNIGSPMIINWIYQTSYDFCVYRYGGRFIFDDVDMGFYR